MAKRRTKTIPARPTNETYEVVVASPLLRPGLTIKTTVSARYVVQTVKALLDKVREINA